jgi:hypothetical protein
VRRPDKAVKLDKINNRSVLTPFFIDYVYHMSTYNLVSDHSRRDFGPLNSKANCTNERKGNARIDCNNCYNICIVSHDCR